MQFRKAGSCESSLLRFSEGDGLLEALGIVKGPQDAAALRHRAQLARATALEALVRDEGSLVRGTGDEIPLLCAELLVAVRRRRHRVDLRALLLERQLREVRAVHHESGLVCDLVVQLEPLQPECEQQVVDLVEELHVEVLDARVEERSRSCGAHVEASSSCGWVRRSVCSFSHGRKPCCKRARRLFAASNASEPSGPPAGRRPLPVPLRPSLIFFTAACASKMRPVIFSSRSAAACISCAVSAMVPTLPQSTPPSGNSSSTSSEGCEVAEGIDILLLSCVFPAGFGAEGWCPFAVGPWWWEKSQRGFLARGSHARGIKWSVWFLVAVRARDQGLENFGKLRRSFPTSSQLWSRPFL